MDEHSKLVEKLALLEILQEVFQCHVCTGSLGADHSLCQHGHGVCSSCRAKLSRCPTCQREFVIHNTIILNKALEVLPKLCVFYDKGCSHIGKMLDNDDHERFCEFRETECKMKGCSWNGSVGSLIDHVKTEHFFYGLSKKTLKASYVFKDTDFYDYSPVLYKDKFFWKHCRRDYGTKLISHKLYYLPIAKPKYEYYLQISFKKGDFEFTSLSQAHININGESQPEKSVLNGSFMIPDNILEQFLFPNKTNKYSYYMKLFHTQIS